MKSKELLLKHLALKEFRIRRKFAITRTCYDRNSLRCFYRHGLNVL